MGIPDSSLLHIIEKVKSWIPFGANESLSLSGEFVIPDNSYKMHCECFTSGEISLRYCCQSCGRLLCEKCIDGCETNVVESNIVRDGGEAADMRKLCTYCSNISVRKERGKKYCEKVHPSISPRESPEPPSPSFSGEGIKRTINIESVQTGRHSQYLDFQDYGCSPQQLSYKTMSSFSAHPSPVSVRPSPSRTDEEDTEDSGRHFFSPTSDYFHDGSDVDSSSVRNESYSYSVESSPSYSPAKFKSPSSRIGHSVQQGQVESPLSPNEGPFNQALNRPVRGTDDQEITDDCWYEKLQRALDFENNALIWFPPPSEVENNEAEDNFFPYDDEEDNIGESGVTFSASSSFPSMFPSKEKLSDDNKEPLKAVVQGHFRALVAQLLQGEDIKSGRENGEDWLDIVTTIAWEAANFVRPDTSSGGSMDPGDYVKIKCIASGSPSESTFIKGVVCTKNIKHKRMTSQYKSPRLFLLGGALEYQRVPNQLASFDTLLHQENDHLKMIIQKIEALRPNVLLVERSGSSFAQEYLLAKDISLVLNVKKPLLERIARSTGAHITPSIDKISMARLGNCKLFRLEKVSEEHETANQFNRKPSKTLMYFEGCPRRLGCTVLLKGMCREELKKVKHVFQYAVFAAYHLSLETSFLADEGASLPKMTLKHSASFVEKSSADISIQVVNDELASLNSVADASTQDEIISLNSELEKMKTLSGHLDDALTFPLSAGTIDYGLRSTIPDSYSEDVPFDLGLNLCSLNECEDSIGLSSIHLSTGNVSELELPEVLGHDSGQLGKIHDVNKPELVDESDLSSEYFSTADGHQSILVSFSSNGSLKGTVCERSRLLRIKFYGCFDKPLGRYLRDDLFDQTSCCRYCKEPAEGHVFCYTHRQGNLTIHVRRLPSIKLPGEQDGKIWMWHRCLKCAQIDGVPPATRRVVMSDAAWGLSFGKFLELSFSNHATANRIANCGHSLQRDCLRYYGFGTMVACFRYSPIDILSVQLPPSVLEFNGYFQLEWMRKEASELIHKVETLYGEILDVVDGMEQKSKSFGLEVSNISEVQNHIIYLKDMLSKERSDYNDMLQPIMGESSQPGLIAVDILELNRLRRSLVIGSYFWDRQLYSLNSLLKRNSSLKADTAFAELKDVGSKSYVEDEKLCLQYGGSTLELSCEHKSAGNYTPSEEMQELKFSEFSTITSRHKSEEEETRSCAENKASLERQPLHGSTLTERIDSAWLGSEQILMKSQDLHAILADELKSDEVTKMGQDNNLHRRRLMSPVRVYSFDSALRHQERMRKGLPPSKLHLSTTRSFHAYGDYRHMVRDPVTNGRTVNSEILSLEAQKLNLLLSSTPYFISSASHMADGVRLLLPQTGVNDVVIAVYDNEPSSIISYALSSNDYENWVSDKSNDHAGGLRSPGNNTDDSTGSSFSTWPSFGSLDLDYIHYGRYGSEETSSSAGSLFTDPKKSAHLRISFGDDYSSSGGKVKFSVTCYFAKQFDTLRKKCCPGEVDFVRSLSRCQRWNAQGGKSNVYFAKTLDERFIIKQVTKTELDSFEEFAPEYFKYLSDSLNSGSPTCLAKILGIYQVIVKHLKGGKEMKMDLMVMENLFFKRSISKIYDLKGSARSRYNPDTTGANKVLLDMNLIEALQTRPIFLGSKAKRSLERAIWNDTSFLASVDVMDYSLLVGIDEKKNELVLGIIDFMRQYTWDKHLETWVKASGILGGSKNASPTIVSPKQYKKRFRKAMTSYFLTVPDQWSS